MQAVRDNTVEWVELRQKKLRANKYGTVWAVTSWLDIYPHIFEWDRMGRVGLLFFGANRLSSQAAPPVVVCDVECIIIRRWW
jgi:hypothetical protein